MTRILILTGDAAESQEVFYPKHRLAEEGWQVDIAGPEGGKAYRSVVHDFEPGFETYTEKPGYLFKADLGFTEVDADTYDGMVIPGGRAPEYLRRKPRAVDLVRAFVATGRPIAVTCHGPLLLIAADAVRGKTLTCYPDLQPDVVSAGGLFVDREVVLDGPLVTARAWPDNGPWMREFVRLVKSNGR